MAPTYAVPGSLKVILDFYWMLRRQVEGIVSTCESGTPNA